MKHLTCCKCCAIGVLSSVPISFSFQASSQLPLHRGRESTWLLAVDASNEYSQADNGLYLPSEPEGVVVPSGATSSSGIPYHDVVDGVEEILPSEGVNERNALSRKDGYWPFIHKGNDPPQEFVYGEFDLPFFAYCLDRAAELFQEDGQPISSWEGRTFCDLGSGVGRLVLAAAALHQWKTCRGVELLEGLHESALSNLEKCRQDNKDQSDVPNEKAGGYMEEYQRQYATSTPEADYIEQLAANFSPPQAPSAMNNDEEQAPGLLDEQEEEEEKDSSDKNGASEYALSTGIRLSPTEFVCGSFDDPYTYIGDSDCVFVFSSAMPEHVMEMISQAAGRQLKPGTIIVTTEYKLPLQGTIEPHPDDPALPSGQYRLELLEEVTGQNTSTGGYSTAFFHRVVESLWLGDGVRPSPPKLSVEDEAFRVAMKHMQGTLTDPEEFKRGVANNMAFHGFPDSWRPT